MVSDVSDKELLPFAYNIVGSYQDAKDVVQEVMLERLRQPDIKIENEKAYLVRAVINRAINWKNKQAKKISEYPGTWLPEPVATESADGALHQRDILSYSLMVLMEKLDARSRAVFILKEAFDYDHEEIASLLDISVENSRKILSRAKKQVRNSQAHTIAPKLPSGYLERYISIIQSGDTKQLEALLHNDVIVTSDGGGKAIAAINPIVGKDHVLQFLSGIYRKAYQDVFITSGFVNHQPALLFFRNGALGTCQIFEMEDGKIFRTYLMRNPDKLLALEAEFKKQNSH